MTDKTDTQATSPTGHRTTEFVAPGPGSWRRLADHFPHALTAEYQRIYAETCPAGAALYMQQYGVLARTLDVGFVHGHLYIAPVPLIGAREPKRAPWSPLLWLTARSHPTLRRRTAAARRALRDRPWADVAERWFRAERDTWIERNRTIEATDPTRVDDASLADHLLECRTLVTDGYRRHFELHGDDLLPVGLLVARFEEWGPSADTATAALAGAPTAPHASTLSRWMLVSGYDLDALTWGELHATEPDVPAPSDAPERDLAIEVPGEHRAEAQTLVADARRAVHLRDDNGAIIAAWPMGLLRRAMLAAGARLFPGDPALAIEATVDELTAQLGDPAPERRDALGERRRERIRRSALAPPRTLGPDLALPSLDALPRPLALIAAAQMAIADHMSGDERAVGVGTDCYRGRAVVVDDPVLAMATFRPGDVVVTRATSPAWNSILAEAGAVVTAHGGLTSHAAITARALGIPAVVGHSSACDDLCTGDMVLVDPVHATVAIDR